MKRDHDGDPSNETVIAGLRFEIMSDFVKVIDLYTDTMTERYRNEAEKERGNENAEETEKQQRRKR